MGQFPDEVVRAAWTGAAGRCKRQRTHNHHPNTRYSNKVTWRKTELEKGNDSWEPHDIRTYRTRIKDDGKTRVTFGDGARGARPPAGVDNIRAEYRIGIGSNGTVGAGQLTILKSTPSGIDTVTDPTATTGGADPEDLEQVRERAPARGRRVGTAVAVVLGILALSVGYYLGSSQSLIVEVTQTRISTETIFQASNVTIIRTSYVTLTMTVEYEEIKITSGFAFYDSVIGNYLVTLKVQNTGSAIATFVDCFINGKQWVDFGATRCTADGDTIGGPAKGTYSLAAGKSVTIEILIPKTAVSPGQTLDIKLHTDTGRDYPRSVVLP